MLKSIFRMVKVFVLWCITFMCSQTRVFVHILPKAHNTCTHTHVDQPTCHFNGVACKSELKVVHRVNHLSINNSSKHSYTSKVNLTRCPQGHTQFPPNLIHTYSKEDLTMHGNIQSLLLNSSSELIF